MSILCLHAALCRPSHFFLWQLSAKINYCLEILFTLFNSLSALWSLFCAASALFLWISILKSSLFCSIINLICNVPFQSITKKVSVKVNTLIRKVFVVKCFSGLQKAIWRKNTVDASLYPPGSIYAFGRKEREGKEKGTWIHLENVKDRMSFSINSVQEKFCYILKAIWVIQMFHPSTNEKTTELHYNIFLEKSGARWESVYLRVNLHASHWSLWGIFGISLSSEWPYENSKCLTSPDICN